MRLSLALARLGIARLGISRSRQPPTLTPSWLGSLLGSALAVAPALEEGLGDAKLHLVGLLGGHRVLVQARVALRRDGLEAAVRREGHRW